MHFPPELFTARAAAAAPDIPSGDETATLDFGFVVLSLSGLRPAQARAAREWARPAGQDSGAEPWRQPLRIALEVRALPAACFRRFDLRGWETPVLARVRPASVEIASLWLAAELSLGATMRGALWTHPGRPRTFPGVLENSLRVAASIGMLRRRGLLVHSAAVVIDGRAHLFVGRSGAGKSTIARLCARRGWRIISDDFNLVIRGANGYAVAAVPFSGSVRLRRAPRTHWPLASIQLLRQATEDRHYPVGRAQSMARILACCPFVNVQTRTFDALTRRVDDLVAAVPVVETRFSLKRGGATTILGELAHA